MCNMNKLINVFYGRFVKIFSLVPNEFIDGGINYDSAYNFGFGRRCVLTYSIGECLGRKKNFGFHLITLISNFLWYSALNSRMIFMEKENIDIRFAKWICCELLWGFNPGVSECFFFAMITTESLLFFSPLVATKLRQEQRRLITFKNIARLKKLRTCPSFLDSSQ